MPEPRSQDLRVRLEEAELERDAATRAREEHEALQNTALRAADQRVSSFSRTLAEEREQFNLHRAVCSP